jgi:hypothetical protein
MLIHSLRGYTLTLTIVNTHFNKCECIMYVKIHMLENVNALISQIVNAHVTKCEWTGLTRYVNTLFKG